MSIRYICIFILCLLSLQACNSSKDEETKIAAPSAFSYPETELSVEKNSPLAFQIPNIVGEQLTYSVNPTLPSGLVLHTIQGYISGIPKVVSSRKTYTITAKNSAGSVSTEVSITVNDKPIPEFYFAQTRYTFTRGQNIAPIGVSTNGIANFVEFSLGSATIISGMTFDSQTGTFAGAPNEVIANKTFIVKGTTEQGDSVYASISFTINDVVPSNLLYSSLVLDLTRAMPINDLIPSSGGGNIMSYSVNPALPAGLTLNPVSGVISGAPSLVKEQALYTITATNSGGSTQVNISITIRDLAPQNLTYGTSSLILTKTVAMQEIRPSSGGGGVISYTITPSLPSGLIFDSLIGAISGTPSVVSPNRAYTITAINSGGTTTANLNVVVKDLPPQNLSYPIVSEIFTKNTQITNILPSVSGGAVSSFTISPVLPAGISLNNLTGVISGTPLVVSSAVSYTVTATNLEGSSTYTFFISVKDESPQNLSYPDTEFIFEKGTVINPLSPINEAGGIKTYGFSPTFPQGIELEQTSGIIKGTPTQIAERTKYKITGQNASGSTTRDIYITVNDIPPVTLSYGSSTFTFNRGENISNLQAANGGGAITVYSVSPALPDGLEINRLTGEISGRPLGHQSSLPYTVTGINSGGQTSTVINLIINDFPPTNLTYFSGTKEVSKGSVLGDGLLPIYSGGDITSFVLDTTGSSGNQTSLPAGMILDNITGALKGSPTIADAVAKTYRIIGSNTGGTTSVTISIRILPSAPNISLPQEIYKFRRGDVIANIIPTNTGDPILANGYLLLPIGQSLPAGLIFNTTTGVISGTPTTVTIAKSYSIRAENAGGLHIVNLNIEITEIPPAAFNYGTNTYEIPVDVTPAGQTTTYTPISLSPTLGGGGGPITSWTITPLLPAGLSFNTTTGVISGIPTQGTGLVAYTINAINSGGNYTRIVNMKIKDLPPESIAYNDTAYSYQSGDEFSIPQPLVIGGQPTYFEVLTGVVPSGITFNTTNGEFKRVAGMNVSGQPATTYVVRACNFEGCSSTATFTLALTDSPPDTLRYLSGFGGQESIVYFTFGSTATSYSPLNDGGLVDNYSLRVVRSMAKGPNYATDNLDLIPTVIKGFVSDGGTCPENACFLDSNPAVKAPYTGECADGYTHNDNYIPTAGEQACVTAGLPSGLSFNSTTGVISGAVSANINKRFSLAVKAVNDGGNTIGDLFVILNNKPSSVVPSTTSGTILTTINLNGSASNDIDYDSQYQYPTDVNEIIHGDRIKSYQWVMTQKPSGSNSSVLNATSNIANFVPDKIGTFKFTLVVGDVVSTSSASEITVQVKDVPPSNLTFGSSAYGFDNFLYQIGDTVNLTPNANGGAIESYTISPSLPTGMSFNTTTGKISGSPTVAIIPTTYTIVGTNTGGSTGVNIKIWVNQKPTALISTVAKHPFGSVLSLNGSGSSDIDGVYATQSPWSAIPKALTYSWEVQSKPVGSVIGSASFSNQSGSSTNITPDLKGTYVFLLTVNDGFVQSSSVTATVTVGTPPSGLLYPTQNPLAINTYAFKKNENIGSKTPSMAGGDASTYSISPSLPSGLNFTTSNGAISGIASSTILPTNYTVTATNNGGSSSVTVKIWINETPIVDAGPSILDAIVGQEVGFVSSINDSDSTVTNTLPYSVFTKSYLWELVGVPALSTKNSTHIVNAGTANARFTPDVEGVYYFRLKYYDGLIYNSNEALLMLETDNSVNQNLLPIANAGVDIQFKTTGSLINLDGSSSKKYKGDPLTYQWAITDKPISSNAVINSSTSSKPNITTDEDGIYTIRLTVSDGTDTSIDYIQISTMPNFNDCTPIATSITGNTTLTKEDSPYCLTANTEISSSAILTVQAGAVIQGGGNSLKITGGSFVANGLATLPISIKDLKLTSQINGAASMNLNYVTLDGGSICHVQSSVSGACKGDISIQNSIFLNLVGNSQIGDTATATDINNNIFINSHGLYVSSHTPNFNINNNYVYNSTGGFSGLGNYFVKIVKDSSKKIKINNNRFEQSDSRKIIQSTNILGQESNITKNLWNGIFSPAQVSSTYITDPTFTLLEPLATSNSAIPDGRKYLP